MGKGGHQVGHALAELPEGRCLRGAGGLRLAAGAAPIRCGYCFASQELDEVPADATDVPLDIVVTEAGFRRLGGG